MALYRPDYKLQKAKELIDSLDNSEDNELIKYYIEYQQSRRCTSGTYRGAARGYNI